MSCSATGSSSGLNGVALFVLRRRDGDRLVPFRTPLHPLTTLLFIASAVYVVVGSVASKPANAIWGASFSSPASRPSICGAAASQAGTECSLRAPSSSRSGSRASSRSARPPSPSARRCAQGGALQPLPAARARRADRPAHRFRHRRDVVAAVGRHDARRRVVRRRRFVVPLRGGGAARSPGSSTSSPRTRGARPSGSSSARWSSAGDIVPNNTHFDTTRANVEARRCDGARPPDRRGATSGRSIASVQGKHGSRGARARADREAGSRAAGDDDGDEQFRRRPAGVAGEPARRRAICRRHRRAALPRRLPLRREFAGSSSSASRDITTSARWRSRRRCSPRWTAPR